MNALTEILSGIMSWRIWLIVGLDDVAGRYRRTILGPFWIVISQIAFIAGIFLLRKSFSNTSDSDYLLFLAASLPVWGLVSGALAEGPTGLLRSKGYIEAYPLPMSIYIVRLVVANFINFLHTFIVFLVLNLILKHEFSFYMLTAFVGLSFLLIFCFGVYLILAPLGGQYRDLGPAIGSALNLIFILTPVFWMPTPEQIKSPIIYLNPFFYLLELVRNPLLGSPFSLLHAGIGISICLLTLVVGIIVYAYKRPQIVYWL